MHTTALTPPTLTKAEEGRINDRTNGLLREHVAANLDDPEAMSPDPVTVFLPTTRGTSRKHWPSR